MHDVIQQTVQRWAYADTATRDLAIVCAVAVAYALVVAWLFIVARRWARVTVATTARIVAMGVLAYLASKVLTGIVGDPRPYLVEHIRPLTAVARDNGFPSDHTLLAAALTASFWWIDRRMIAPFALATLLVMAGRLGIGAHHTIDVVGSVAIVAVAALIAGALPLPRAWRGISLAAPLTGLTKQWQRRREHSHPRGL